jgi:uncharacterized paraquat-inducible protein A
MDRRLLIMAHVALLALYPVAWGAPILTAGLLPWFGQDNISILSGILALLGSDPILGLLIAVLAIIAPFGKTVLGLASLVLDRDILGASVAWLMSRLAMADIFLISLYIVIAKGVGVGHIQTRWGLYVFTLCVLLSMVLSLIKRPKP